ncbi:amidohydrolase family protein [Rhizocola hellebori]|uniref:amidohydrolase family protein n=1 Tax=Rhizocola hellebori TaxID=1392758 RepID=UPI001940B7C5|nr:amidohydrolase family protein [Rhizocola hellebori]
MAVRLRGVVLPEGEMREILVDAPGPEVVVAGGFILPGLVDAHCHIGIAPGGAPVTSLEQARELAIVDRDAGVLAIRDAGSPFPYPSLDDDPELPRLARAGRHVAPQRRYLPEIGQEVPPSEVAAEVTRQAKAGNGWVKLVGDWIDRDRGDLSPAWEDDILTAAVQAAHAAGVRMTAHCFEEHSIATLVRAGIDCVEHGTGLSLDVIDEMARRGTALVPTMINIETFGHIADRAEGKFPKYASHMRHLQAGFPAVVRAAYEAGVPIYAGSDAGGGIDHGLVAQEMLRLHAAGMSTMDVLRAGSWGAREWLGFPTGADFTVYDTDPRDDLRVLQSPSHIILRGRLLS